jgi:hypothetical protein
MRIENTFRTAQIRMAYIILMAMIALSILLTIFDKSAYQIYSAIMAMVTAIAYIILNIINPHYFYYNDDKNPIVIRFYKANPFFRKYKSYEIQKNELVNYKFVNKIFGLQKFIVFTIRKKQNEANYPPINISGLTKNELSKLEKCINKTIIDNRR